MTLRFRPRSTYEGAVHGLRQAQEVREANRRGSRRPGVAHGPTARWIGHRPRFSGRDAEGLADVLVGHSEQELLLLLATTGANRQAGAGRLAALAQVADLGAVADALHEER